MRHDGRLCRSTEVGGVSEKRARSGEREITREVDNPVDRLGWSVGRRRWVSALLAFHVFAVFLAPMAAPPPTSQLAQRIAAVFDPYLRGLAINNGYRFFAPNPGPSHLVRYELVMEDGRVEGGEFPDPRRHRPRLLYHRMFMIAEVLADRAQVLDEPEDIDRWPAEARDGLREDQRQVREFCRAVARDAARGQTGIERVRLYSREHLIPTPEQLRSGTRIDDPNLYVEIMLAEFTGSEL